MPFRNTPKDRAVVGMAIASSLHFAGYELARSGSMALFTSQRTGFSSNSAVPFCTACVSPFSVLLLWLYTRSLDRWGPRQSLKYSTFIFALIMASGAILIRSLEPHLNQNCYRQLARISIFFLNVSQNCFCSAIYTQHWSFLGSICDQEGAVYFAPIAGLGSVASTLAAMAVTPLVKRIGLTGLLLASSIFLLASAFFADDAYRIAQLVSSSLHGISSQGQCMLNWSFSPASYILSKHSMALSPTKKDPPSLPLPAVKLVNRSSR
jgi:hypothetical protein